MNKIIMTLAGLLLIAAAGLKFYEMIETCVPAWQAKAAAAVVTAEKAGEQLPQWKATVIGVWESYEFNLFQIPLEFALGIWLVSGLFRKAAWIAGTLAFFGFIFVTLTKWLTGAASCGCFGQIHVDPRFTLFTIDIPFFLLLAIFRPKGTKLLPPPWPNLAWLLVVFVPTIGLMVAAPPAMVALRPDCIKVENNLDETAPLKLEIYKLRQELQKRTQSADSLRQQVNSQKEAIEQLKQQIQSLLQQLQAFQQTPAEPNMIDTTPEIITEPNIPTQQQPTQPDPIPTARQWDWLQYVVEDDVREQLTQELVVVMMHRFDCPTCEEMAPRYSEYYAQMVENDNVLFKIAFLAIPPYGETNTIPEDTTCINGKLTDEKDWQLMSPYVVALLNGEKVKEWPEGTAPEPEKLFDEIFGQ